MEYYYRDFKPSAALTELRIIQRRRRIQKMVDTGTIGDGEITMVDGNPLKMKTYKGNVTVVRIQDQFQIEVGSCGKRQLIIPCEEIISRSVQKETVILQFKVDYFWEKGICKFHVNAQADVFNSKLPSINKPISTDYNATNSSDTDFDDSGNEKSEGFKNNSFKSDTPSVEIQEL
ncbi:uncharacterized protein LOC123015259 isoform X2 [Tribolium madens]|uniref:uncharacterized protein LOC123015259 isoform X2 n=1 Tax=Tribolium madens TaxID=41895 RepID=UPI001CF75D44|nr:uncharacterized protein LOC123015259 isoform X2 [Tribolium madens]